MAERTQTVVRTSEPPRLHVLARLKEIWHFREILFNVVRKEVKVKYVSSVLGAVWSMLNPTIYLVVFGIVFTLVLPAKIPSFPVFLLSGLLAWNVFSASVTVATQRSEITEVARNGSRAVMSDRCTSTAGSAAISRASRTAIE